MNNEIPYSDAISELENILSDIENENIGVDELTEKVKRAAFLIRICREKLFKTEEEVNAILLELKEIDSHSADNNNSD